MDLPSNSNRKNRMVQTSNYNNNKIILIHITFQQKNLHGSNLRLIIRIFLRVPIEKIAWLKLATKIKIR